MRAILEKGHFPGPNSHGAFSSAGKLGVRSFPVGNALTPFPYQPAVQGWIALRTAAQWEKKLAESLSAIGVPVFLPLMTRISVYRSKRRAVEVPIFSGYLFCEADGFIGNPRVSAGFRSKVAQVLRPSDPAQLRSELRRVAGLLTDRQLIQERVVGKPGDVVRITGGSLIGCEGTILRMKPNKWQVVLEVSFIGARIVAEVDDRLIEKIGTSA
jgi:transcription antitermination factor NusG